MGALDVMQFARMESPRGSLLLTASAKGLCRVEFPAAGSRRPQPPENFDSGSSAVLESAIRQLGEYFSGRRKEFDLALDLRGTVFQKQVWQQLLQIPFGILVSYRDVATAIGKPRAVRAVGGAIGRNPLLFVVPCHRVVGKNGALTGFTAGLDHKRWLLAHEEALLLAPSLGITEA